MIQGIKYFSITLIFILMMAGCSRAQSSGAEKGDFLNEKKVLIVYLSRTNNTKAVADMIHELVGGNLVGLELENPYPDDYQANVDQVAKENEMGYLPPLKTKIDNIADYDIVFVGFPTWGMKLPPPMKTFLKQYDLSGKIIIPFNTNAGYGTGSSFETVKQMCPDSRVLDGFSTEGGKERDGIMFVMKGEKEVQVNERLQHWLQQINLLK